MSLKDQILKGWNDLGAMLKSYMRRIKDVDEWDGSASRWETTEGYCRACLVDVNQGDDKTQSHCMLPIREPGDSSDTYVRQAVYAAAGGRGISAVKKPDDVPQDEWDSAVKRAADELIRAYDEMDEVAPDSVYELAGKSPPERAVSFESMYWDVMMQAWEIDDYASLIDNYTDDSGNIFAVIASGGKLYTAPIAVENDQPILSPDWTLVIHKEEFEPVQNMFRLREMADGKTRWFSVSATATLNRVGEIDSRELFDSFVEHAEKTGEYPIRQFYHCGAALKTGQADFLAREGNLYITSGIYDDSELAQREIVARKKEPEYWGDSIGFYVETPPLMLEISDGIHIPVHTRGINYEISTLPEAHAASWLTNNTCLQEVKRTMEKRQMEALTTLFDGDEDAVQDFVDGLEDVNLTIREANMITREDSTEEAETEQEPEAEAETEPIEDETETEEEEETPDTEEDETEIEIGEDVIQAIAERVAASIGERIQDLETAVSEVRETLEAQEAINVRNHRRFEQLERDDQEKMEEIRQDLPPKFRKKRVSLRKPREQNAKETGQDSTMSETAVQTLEKFSA